MTEQHGEFTLEEHPGKDMEHAKLVRREGRVVGVVEVSREDGVIASVVRDGQWYSLPRIYDTVNGSLKGIDAALIASPSTPPSEAADIEARHHQMAVALGLEEGEVETKLRNIRDRLTPPKQEQDSEPKQSKPKEQPRPSDGYNPADHRSAFGLPAGDGPDHRLWKRRGWR